MNWWSAFIWCEEIGGQLARFEHACPGAQTNSSGPCPNFKGISRDSNVWLNKGWGNDRALTVWTAGGSGTISVWGRTAHGVYHISAFCEER